MSQLSLFSNELANSDIFKRFQKATDNLTSGSGGITTRRISLKGGKFRQFVNGEQMHVSKENEMNIVIVDAAPLSRTYYEGTYDPANPTPPVCWSNDTNTKKPAEAVENPVARSCDDCPNNVKGSGQGQSRACRFGQRLAVALEGDLNTVYQLQLPATSIFGDAKGDKMPMQAYARFLKANGAPAAAIVTTMFFDEDAEVPKLYFRPARPLTEEELEVVSKAMDSEDTKRAIEFTVAQTDKLIATDAPAPAKEEPKAEPVEEKKASKGLFADADEVEEPKKVSKKPQVEESSDLASIIDDWDDE